MSIGGLGAGVPMLLPPTLLLRTLVGVGVIRGWLVFGLDSIPVNVARLPPLSKVLCLHKVP